MTATFEKILIANRGEIARRIMRTCREMGISTVAVASEADRDAPFAREADEVVPLGGLRPAESYLRIEAIIEAARASGSDAVHPGYGFLSENAEFARACQEAGIAFIGPPAEVIAAMGSKIEAKRRMQSADVPMLPTFEVADRSAETVLREIESLNWPLMIKASAGGGGRGMRIVRSPGEFAGLLDVARQESQAAFGSSDVFIEPYVESPRHIEVQIFGDTQGNVVHLFERECSIQRRHQKIIEECPSPALDDELRRAITGAAVRAAKAIGYVNAGTVEFLLTPDRTFYFLEVNTRLQVEHPVTECVTELDLVRLQILVAAGEPLPDEVRSAGISGHAIEARLYAEDPRHNYRPSAGKLHRLRLPAMSGLRVDSAIDDAGTVSPFYDPMLAKIIVHAPSRSDAVRRLAQALRRAKIHGLATNRELLVRTLEHPEFLSGAIDTHFLDRHDAAALAAPLGDEQVQRLHAVAAALAAQAARRQEANVLPSAPSGWRNNPSQPQQTRFQTENGELLVEYQFQRGGTRLWVDGVEQVDLRVVSATSDEVRLTSGAVERAFGVEHCGDTWYVDSPLGTSALVELPRFKLPEEEIAAGSLVAPLPGVVNEVKVNRGDIVAQGDVVLVIDSMKVFHWISAPVAGRIVEIRVDAGNHVEAGAVLAVIDENSTS